MGLPRYSRMLFILLTVLYVQGSEMRPFLNVPQTEHKHTGDAHHRFQDTERWAAVFEDPERDVWQKPDVILSSMGLNPNSRVADIGSATGYFPVKFATLAQEGHVYGIDVEQNMVDYLNERARKEGLENLSSILGDFDDPNIPEPVDIIFICDTYHHIQNRTQYFQNLKKYFLPGGSLIIVDFKMGDLPVGPPDRAKLPQDQVIQELLSAGYRLIPSEASLPYQYFLHFSPGPH